MPPGTLRRSLQCDSLQALYAHRLLMRSALRRLSKAGIRRCESTLLLQRLARTVVPITADPAQQQSRQVRLRNDLRRYMQTTPEPPSDGADLGQPMADNLRLCSGLLDLNPVEVDVLRFALAADIYTPLGGLLPYFGKLSLRACAAVVAASLGRPLQTVLPVLLPSGRLRQMGLLSAVYGTPRVTDCLELRGKFADALRTPGLDRATLFRRFVPEAPAAELAWAAFSHLHTEAEDVCAILQGALAQRTVGINILFYGVTGAGKTALARGIATRLGVPLHMAAFADRDGDSLSGRERAEAFALAQRLIAPGTAVVLFDEFDEALSVGCREGRHDGLSKHWVNDQLEHNRAPAIYICNDLDSLDPAYLRRFAYAIHFMPPSPAVRQRVLAVALGQTHTLTPVEMATLCQSYPVSPAHLHSAVRTAALIGNAAFKAATLGRILAPLSAITAEKRHQAQTRPDLGTYNPAWVNADFDLQALTSKLACWSPGPHGGLSLLLHGPPGTGKSAYLQHLAQQMGRSIVYRQPSDLLGCYVGQTEKNIASAFREAQAEGAVLIFDEVDSFLQARNGSMRTWETTVINTFLQQLENNQGIVGCTTNRLDDLDPAALRRFVFKITLRYPQAQRQVEMFDAFLGPYLKQPLTQADRDSVGRVLKAMPQLTPADFSGLAKRHAILQQRNRCTAVLEELLAETRYKRLERRPAGFGLDVAASVSPRIDDPDDARKPS